MTARSSILAAALLCLTACRSAPPPVWVDTQVPCNSESLVYEVPGMEPKEAFAWTADLSQRLFKSEEAAAGMKAFLKREKPPWAADRG